MSEVKPISSELRVDDITDPADEPAGSAVEAGSDDGEGWGPLDHNRPQWGRTLGTVVTASALAALYFLFVLHYSVNFMVDDEWGLVPIIHAALHSHLTLGDLWAQHNENRMLVPNLVIVGSSLAQNYNSKSIILLGATFFIASYGLLLATFRTYLGRSPTPLAALSLGVVWFSLEDTENALWGFQLAWYMIIFFLMVLVFLLLRDWRHRNVVYILATVCTVAASFSSLQGLMLWPVGLICLAWDRPNGRRRNLECGIWFVLCAVTTAIYFRAYTLPFNGPSRSPAFALHHPVEMAQYFLASLGDVVPTTSTELGGHELLGLALFIAATFVVVRSWLDRATRTHTVFPVALIVFGVLFDGSISLGRLGLGVADALTVRYTMANLLVLTGVVIFAWTHLRPWWDARADAGLRGKAECVGIVAVTAFLVIQWATATNIGVTTAEDSVRSRTVGARTVVNLDRIPSSEAELLVSTYVYPTLAAVRPYLHLAEEDHLSVFAPGPYRTYRCLGPPHSHEVRHANASSDDTGRKLTLSGCAAHAGGSGAIGPPSSDPTVVRWSGGGTTPITTVGPGRSTMNRPDGADQATLAAQTTNSTIRADRAGT